MLGKNEVLAAAQLESAAALVSVARVLLNSDAFITRE
jgi:hypothetical protein